MQCYALLGTLETLLVVPRYRETVKEMLFEPSGNVFVLYINALLSVEYLS